MNQEQKYQLCSRLADLGVIMDEYRANAVVGKNDVALESIGGSSKAPCHTAYYHTKFQACSLPKKSSNLRQRKSAKEATKEATTKTPIKKTRTTWKATAMKPKPAKSALARTQFK